MSEPPRRFEEFRRRAESLVDSPGRLQRLTRQVAAKMSSAGGSRLLKMRDQLGLALALVSAWMSGEYREVSKSTIVALVAALLYFAVPFDVIPDFLFGWGFLDDAAVLGYVFAQLSAEIEAFRRFREQDGAVDAASTSNAVKGEVFEGEVVDVQVDQDLRPAAEEPREDKQG